MTNLGVASVANPKDSALIDVVFVHGLGGDGRETWSSAVGDTSWPEMLAQEHPWCAVWSVTYAAPFTTFARAPGMAIREQGASLALQLRNVGIGARPLIFIMHSLGGLVVKAMCAQSALGNEDNKAISESIVGLVFCATPHRGSAFATVARALGGLTGRQIRELRANTDDLTVAHRDFVAWHAAHSGVAIQTYYETIGVAHKYWLLPFVRTRVVVTQSSADTGIAGSPMYPIDADHLSIVKPSAATDPICAGVARFISEIGPAARQARRILSKPMLSSFEHNLPYRNPFIGRTADLHNLCEALDRGDQSVLVTGLGGMGKSATTIEALHSQIVSGGHTSSRRHYEAIVWLSAKDRDLRLAEVLTTSGAVLGLNSLGAMPADEQADILLDTFSKHACVLVIDNFDHVSDPELLGLLSRVNGKSTVVLTSRQLEADSNATLIRLGSLDLEDAVALLIAEFARHGGEASGSLTRAQLEDLCRECGCVPLALKWAAGQIASRGQGIETVCSQLQRGEGSVFDSLFEGAWNLLTHDGQNLLAALSVSTGGGTIASLAATAGMTVGTSTNAVNELAKLCLVEFTPAALAGDRRYSLHPLTASFVRGRVANDQQHSYRLALAQWLLGQVGEVLTGTRDVGALLTELPSLMSTIRWCASVDEWVPVLRLTVNLREVLPDAGKWNEALEVGMLGIRAAERLGDRYHEGRLAVIPLGWIARYRGQLADSELWYRRAVDAFTAVGDLDRAAWAQLALANLLLRRGQEPDARAIAEGVRDSGVGATGKRVDVVRAAALVHLSEMAVARGDLPLARDFAEQAQRLSRATGYINTTMSATYWLGMATLWEGDATAAEALLRESLQLNTNAGVKMGIALCLVGLTECLLDLDRPGEAVKCASDGRALLVELGMRQELANFIMRIEPRLEKIGDPISRSASYESTRFSS